MKITKKELEALIENKIRKRLNESGSKDVVFIEKLTSSDYSLWISYNPGSGHTVGLKSDMKRFFSSDNKSKYYDYTVNSILKDWVPMATPIKKNKVSKVFAIPVYDLIGYERTNDHLYGVSYKDLDIFNGDIKPIGIVYMVVSTETSGIKIVNFFKKKNEAFAWLAGQV